MKPDPLEWSPILSSCWCFVLWRTRGVVANRAGVSALDLGPKDADVEQRREHRVQHRVPVAGPSLANHGRRKLRD